MVKPAKGTTTLAFIFKEGVMVAADSRASMGGYICEAIFIFNLVLGFSCVMLMIFVRDFNHMNDCLQDYPFFLELRYEFDLRI